MRLRRRWLPKLTPHPSGSGCNDDAPSRRTLPLIDLATRGKDDAKRSLLLCGPMIHPISRRPAQSSSRLFFVSLPGGQVMAHIGAPHTIPGSIVGYSTGFLLEMFVLAADHAIEVSKRSRRFRAATKYTAASARDGVLVARSSEPTRGLRRSRSERLFLFCQTSTRFAYPAVWWAEKV